MKNQVIEPAVEIEWNSRLSRTGVLARKIGVVPMWLKDGTKISTTMLQVTEDIIIDNVCVLFVNNLQFQCSQVIDNHVIKYIPPEEYKPMVTGKKDYEEQRYGCMIVGAQGVDPQKVNFVKAIDSLYIQIKCHCSSQRNIVDYSLNLEYCQNVELPGFKFHPQPHYNRVHPWSKLISSLENTWMSKETRNEMKRNFQQIVYNVFRILFQDEQRISWSHEELGLCWHACHSWCYQNS